MPAESNLQRLLQDLNPELLPGEFVYTTAEGFPKSANLESELLATVKEPEGLTLILTRTYADAQGLKYELSFRRLLLTVHSSLEAVGLTAVVSGALANHGISANILAGYYHDQILVPSADAVAALEVLKSLKPQPTE